MSQETRLYTSFHEQKKDQCMSLCSSLYVTTRLCVAGIHSSSCSILTDQHY